jgi:hypothetical protein
MQCIQLSLDLAYTGKKIFWGWPVTKLPEGSDLHFERPTDPASEGATFQEQSVFRISPLIWITLWCLYLALTIPLPFLSNITTGSISAKGSLLAIALGGIALHTALSEQVILE